LRVIIFLMRRKPHRLPREEYIGRKAIGFTACERYRRPLLATRETFELVHTGLEIACRKHDCTVPMFTLMPDHAHFLIMGSSEASDGMAAMEYLKWFTGSAFKSKKMQVRWQEESWDHIVRGIEGWASFARYIALNPVRKGLCAHPEEWPFSGSVGYTFEDVLDDAIWS
jgi:putative transposase